MTKPQILIALGSPSDKKLLAKLALDESVDYHLSIASAHRTPDTVELHSKQLSCFPWDAIVAGAGLTNALLSEYLRRAEPKTIVIGLPVTDTETKGLSSLLSSQELPPGYPAAAVAVDELGRAAKIAAQLTTGGYDKVVIYDFTKKGKGMEASATLIKFGINHDCITKSPGLEKIERGTLPLVVLESIAEANAIQTDGPIIATTTGAGRDYSAGYIDLLKNHSNLGMVSFGSPTNLALFGAKVLSRQNPEVGEKINAYLAEGRKKYEPYKSVIPLDSPEKIKEIVEAK